MKIAVIGCSWSSGENNWVQILSTKYPNHHFTNFSVCGVSIEYQTYILDKIKNNFDLVLFQITSLGRFTFWENHDINNFLYNESTNLKQIDEEIYKFVKRINYGVILKKPYYMPDDVHKFGQKYYSIINREQLDLDYKLYTQYIKNQADLCFFHRKGIDKTDLSVLEKLGKDNFYKYTIDDGDHFSNEGNIWVSNWIEDTLKSKGLL
jgi:hypothetical protein